MASWYSCSMVCLCVCMCVCMSVCWSWQWVLQNSWRDQDIELWTRVGPRNHVLGVIQILPKEGGNFGCKRHNTAELRPMRALGCNAPWIRFLIFFALYILFACLCCMLPHLFLTYLLPYLSFLLRIDPLHFEARCCRRWLNLALVFCVIVHFFGLVNVC